MPLTEGVTLSGVPMGTRTVRGCDSGEALNGVPKVQSGPAANLSGKRTEEIIPAWHPPFGGVGAGTAFPQGADSPPQPVFVLFRRH